MSIQCRTYMYMYNQNKLITMSPIKEKTQTQHAEFHWIIYSLTEQTPWDIEGERE